MRVDAVDGELDPQGRGLGPRPCPRGALRGRPAQSAFVRHLVVTEEALHPGARRGESDAQGAASEGRSRCSRAGRRGSRRSGRGGEVPARARSSSTRSCAGASPGAVAAQPRTSVPRSRGRGGRPLAGLAQDCDGPGRPAAGALDVVGASGGGAPRAARAAAHRSWAPAASRPGSSRRRRGAQADAGTGTGGGGRSAGRGPRPQQLVERGRALRARRRRRRPLRARARTESPATAAPSSTRRARVGEQGELLGERGGHGRRDVEPPATSVAPGRRGARPRERASCSR